MEKLHRGQNEADACKPADARAAMLFLTPAGKQSAADADAAMAAAKADLAAALGVGKQTRTSGRLARGTAHGKHSASELAAEHAPTRATLASIRVAIAAAHAPLANLLAANHRGDAREAMLHATKVRGAERAIGEQLAALPAKLREQWTAKLVAVREQLLAALTRAPRTSQAARDEGKRGNWARYDQEIADWVTNARQPEVAARLTLAKHSIAPVSDVDRAKVDLWFQQNLLDATKVTGEITHGTVSLILEAEREFDQAALRQALQLVVPSGHVSTTAFAQYLAVARFELERAEMLGRKNVINPFDVTTRSEAKSTVDAGRLPGKITQHSGLVVSGRETSYEVAIDFSRDALVADRQFWETAMATVDWFFQRVDKPGPREHVHTDRRCFKTLKLGGAADARGVWRVDAFVKTQGYRPTRFTTLVEVKTDAERLRDLKRDEFAEGQAVPDGKEHEFDWSRRDSIAPDLEVVKGTRVSSPLAFEARSLEQRVAHQQNHVVELTRVLEFLTIQPGEHAVAIDAVRDSLDRLKKDNAEILVDTALGWRMFDVRTAFHSTTEQAQSGSLEILGQVRRTTLDAAGLVPDQEAVHVRLRDFSRRVMPEVTTYEGYGRTFEQALQSAFEDLTHDYPPGVMAVYTQEYDSTGRRPTGQMLGFERRTSSSGKEFNKRYGAAINTALSLASIVFPPLRAVTAVISIVDSLTEISDHMSRGTLTGRRVIKSGLDIVTSVLPAIGQARFIQSSKWLKTGVFALETGADAYLFTSDVRDELLALQNNDVASIAEMYEELVLLEKSTHASDPRLVERREAIERRALGMRDNLAKAVGSTAFQRGVVTLKHTAIAELSDRLGIRNLFSPVSGHAAELDALFAHRDAIANRPALARPSANAKPSEIKAHAVAASKRESVARIEAEIDLAVIRMGLAEAGPARERKLATLPKDVADKIRRRLASGVFEFRADAVIADAEVARPAAVPTTLATSKVLPDAPTQVHAYKEQDRVTVVELRVEIETIKEIDARVALRDQPGTHNSPDIAKGDTRRRQQHVARARALMDKLQLGGGDVAYLESRLSELSRVFPAAAADIVPAVRQRIARRYEAENVQAQAIAFQAKHEMRQQALVADLKKGPATTLRILVGGGVSAVANVATLGMRKTGDWISQHDLLAFGNADLTDRIAPDEQWGQRAAVYDRSKHANPAFSDGDGAGRGDLLRAVEDQGEFMHVGELNNALDVARERLGLATIPATVLRIETTKSQGPNAPAWEANAMDYPVRATISIDGTIQHVYAKYADIVPGPGVPNLPAEHVLSAEHRAQLLGPEKDDPAVHRVLISGDRLLGGMDLRGKRVLVIGLGPTGGWDGLAALKHGAALVDIAGVSRRPGDLQAANRANESSLGMMKKIDRLQGVFDGSADVGITLDTITSIVPERNGAIVTFTSVTGETRAVKYDVVASAIGYSHSATAPRVPGSEPGVGTMLGDMPMKPHTKSKAPVTQDESGRVRVLGYGAGEGVNLSNATGTTDLSASDELADRGRLLSKMISSDSPDHKVVEGAGIAIRDANREGGSQ